MDFGTVQNKRAFELIKRSFIFSNLSFEKFGEVLSFLGGSEAFMDKWWRLQEAGDVVEALLSKPLHDT